MRTSILTMLVCINMACWSTNSTAAKPTEVYQSMVNANYAFSELYGSDGMSAQAAEIHVGEFNSNGPGNGYFLNYFNARCTGDWLASTCTWYMGWGVIPHTSFKVTPQKSTLYFDTNTSDFTTASYTEICTMQPDYSRDCSYYDAPQPSTSLIAIDWMPSSNFKGSMNGTTTWEYGNYTQRLTGSSSYGTAIPSGSLLGSDLASFDSKTGRIGTHHNASIYIFPNR